MKKQYFNGKLFPKEDVMEIIASRIGKLYGILLLIHWCFLT